MIEHVYESFYDHSCSAFFACSARCIIPLNSIQEYSDIHVLDSLIIYVPLDQLRQLLSEKKNSSNSPSSRCVNLRNQVFHTSKC
jgi:hypothetical protein